MAFNLFAEGLRSASDPFSRFRLSPSALGGIGRALAAGALVALTVFGYLTVRSTTITFDDGLVQARAAAERFQPGSELIAGVVRFRSSEHALSRPEKINYYFRHPSESAIVRVGFEDADANAMEVKRFDHEDDLFFDGLQRLGQWKVGWEKALGAAEELEGRNFRNSRPEYVVRVVLQQEVDAALPSYRVQYGAAIGPPQLEIPVDGEAGIAGVRPGQRLADARSRARTALRGGVQLVGIRASWQSRGPGRVNAFGADQPSSLAYTFIRADLPTDTRSVTVSYAGPSILAQIVGGTFATRPAAIPEVDPEMAFAQVEDAGGRAVRERWESEGDRQWTVTAVPFASAPQVGDHVVLTFIYFDGAQRRATFRYDIGSRRAEPVGEPAAPSRVPVQFGPLGPLPSASPRAP